MSRTLETKKLLLEKLGRKKSTVTDLSRELGLAKSTVSQHLAELKRMGMVDEENDMFFRKVKYFRLSQEKTGAERRIVAGWQGYIVLAVVIAAVAGGVYWLNGQQNGPSFQSLSTNTLQTSVNPGGPATGVRPVACPLLQYYKSANYSDVSTVIGYIANGSPCYVTYVNTSASMLRIGGGTPYTSGNGTVNVASVNYSYTLDARQMSRLKNESSANDCWAYTSLQFFNVSYPEPQTCNANIYS